MQCMRRVMLLIPSRSNYVGCHSELITHCVRLSVADRRFDEDGARRLLEKGECLACMTDECMQQSYKSCITVCAAWLYAHVLTMLTTHVVFAESRLTTTEVRGLAAALDYISAH